MKFPVDAQLPRRLAEHLREAGLSAIHTLDHPDGNRTTDLVINESKSTIVNNPKAATDKFLEYQD